MIALLVVLFAAAPRFDLVLSGGRVIDGTGAPWVHADVGIRGDRIAAIGDLSRARAKKRIRVPAAMAVSPGFIDLLGQSELTILVDPRAESKIRQGITSELTGEGGSRESSERTRSRSVVAMVGGALAVRTWRIISER